MKTVHPGRMYTPPCWAGCKGGLPALQGLGGSSPRLAGPGEIGPLVGVRGRSPQRKNLLVNVYCNFIVNVDRSL
jgi:hypothetical protein